VLAHVPVLLKEVLEVLNPSQGEFIIDGTLGEGGHTKAFIEAVKPDGKILATDWDKGNVENAKTQIDGSKLKSLILRNANYADLPGILREEKLGKADALLLDVGFASGQLTSGRGFSFQKDEPLLMTYSDDQVPAYAILRQLKERELAEMIRELSDEKYSGRIARVIKEEGKKVPIVRTGRLAEIIKSAVPKNYEHGRINPATRTFMALRIYTNDELGNLDHALQNLEEIVKVGGRVAVISFHSKEDKIVKNYFRDMSREGKAELITKKPITPQEEEIRDNPKSRSAKLRAIKIT